MVIALKSFQSTNRSFALTTDWVWDPALYLVQSSLFESFSNLLVVSDSISDMQSLGSFGQVREAGEFLSNVQLEMIDLDASRYSFIRVYNLRNGFKGKRGLIKVRSL